MLGGEVIQRKHTSNHWLQAGRYLRVCLVGKILAARHRVIAHGNVEGALNITDGAAKLYHHLSCHNLFNRKLVPFKPGLDHCYIFVAGSELLPELFGRKVLAVEIGSAVSLCSNQLVQRDRKSTRLNSSHRWLSY